MGSARQPLCIRRDPAAGLALSALLLWFPFVLGFSAGGDTAVRNVAVFFLMFAGYFLAALTERFLHKTVISVARAGCTAALVVLSAVFAFLSPGGWLWFCCALLSAVALSFLLLGPVSSLVTRHGGLASGLWCLLFCAVFSVFLQWASPGLQHPAARFLVSCLLIGGQIVSLEAERLPSRPEGLLPKLPRGPIITRLCLAGSALCVLCLLGQISRLLSLYGTRVTVPMAGSALLFILTGCVFWLFILRRYLWQLCYTTFACFALGTLLTLLPAGGLFSLYFPLFCFVAALEGFLILTLTFGYFSVSSFNRALLLGLCLLFAQFALADWSRLLHTPLSLLGGVPPFGSLAFGFLVSPLFILFFALPEAKERKKSRRKDSEPSGSPREAAEEDVSEDAAEEWGEKSEVAQEAAPSRQEQLYRSLTPAERKVFELILRGYSNQQMADTLYVSLNTIKYHIRHILAKAQVSKKYMLLELVSSPLSPALSFLKADPDEGEKKD